MAAFVLGIAWCIYNNQNLILIINYFKHLATGK
jgi:hypothetical protein